MSSDVLIHQQSFDYALSKVCSSIIDWFPTEALHFSSSRPREDTTPRNNNINSPSKHRLTGNCRTSNPIAADGDDETSQFPTDCRNIMSPPHSDTQSTSITPCKGSTSSLPLGEETTASQRGILSKGYQAVKSAAVNSIHALRDPLGHVPLDLTTHTFVSSVGSGTIWDTHRHRRREGDHGGVVFRSGIYSFIRLSGALSGQQDGDVVVRRTPFSFIGSMLSAAKPLVQFRCSACSEDRSKEIGLRATLQDAQISAMDIILHTGRGRDSMPLYGVAPFFSHMCRIDHHLITNYIIFNLFNSRTTLTPTSASRHPILRRIKLGFGVVLRNDLGSGINLLWGFCVELLQSIVVAFHIDALRRCCVTASARNICGVPGLSGAMRLRVNLITARQTILDFGIHRVSSIQQIAGEGLYLGKWTWKASCSGEGAVFGGSLEGAEVSSILRKLAQIIDVPQDSDLSSQSRQLDKTDENKSVRWSSVVSCLCKVSNVGYLAFLGYPFYYSQIASDEVIRLWRSKMALDVNSCDGGSTSHICTDKPKERHVIPLSEARRSISGWLSCPSLLKDTRLDVTCGFALMSFPLLRSTVFLSSFASVTNPFSDYQLFMPSPSSAGPVMTASHINGNGSSVSHLDRGPSRFWSYATPPKVNCFFVVSFS